MPVSTRKELQTLIDVLLREENYDGLDDRRFPRYRIHLSVECQPVTINGDADGEPFQAMTENMSETGINLLVEDEPLSEYLRLIFPAVSSRSTEFTMRVLRSTEYGPFHHVAGEFLWYESVDAPEAAAPATV